MNNEPVAWMLVDASWNDFCRYSSYPSEGAIPLYTHPVKEPMMVLDGNRVYPAFKELTDEEIMDLWCDLLEDASKDIRIFARAILRKASEK